MTKPVPTLVVNEDELTFDEDDHTARYDGQRFTGRSVGVADDGTRCEQDYDRGLKHGSFRVRAPDGMLLVESHHAFGGGHGLHRKWHRNAQLAEECMCEDAFVVWERHWDADGNVTLDYRMPEDDPHFSTLSDETVAAARARLRRSSRAESSTRVADEASTVAAGTPEQT